MWASKPLSTCVVNRKRTSKKRTPVEPTEPMRDFVTGELLDHGPSGSPAGPIAAEGTPFARVHNGVHQLGLAGSDNRDGAAQELARAIEEALPAALAAWPDKERLLPLQRLKSHLAELRYHSDWKRTLDLLIAVRGILPELIDRASMEAGKSGHGRSKVIEHRGSAKRQARLSELRQLLATPEWQDVSQAALAAKLKISERTVRSYLDEIDQAGK